MTDCTEKRGNIPAAEERMNAVDVMDHLDSLHGGIQTFGDSFVQLGRGMVQLASEMAKERPEK